ncbi:MAG: radical SAM protein [Alistipes sp.]|nr:radical SAM protein [Alistipes sp.]
MTALFEDVIFGPVRSRRLGLSLGVNLLPVHAKLCTFDCIYCECGWNAEHRGSRRFNAREVVREALAAKLQAMAEEGELPDVVTFAGNGEPTMHPDFEQIIDDTIALRDRFCPEAKISVLSNATQLHRAEVVRALRRVDNNILKLDSAFDATVQRMNRPQQAAYTVARVVEQMRQFEGQFILQTMFLRGVCDGEPIDNTSPEEVAAWVRIVESLRPKQVMIYSLDRDTPCKTLERVSREELLQLAAHIEALGIAVSVA